MEKESSKQKPGLSDQEVKAAKLAVKFPGKTVWAGWLPLTTVLTLITAWILFWAGDIFWETKKLECFGKSTQGMVSSRTEETIEKKDSDGKKYLVHHYQISYRFQITMPDGQQQTFPRTEQVIPELYHQLTEGAELLIVYDSENPHTSHIKGNYLISIGDRVVPIFLFRGGLLFFFLLGAMFFHGFIMIAILFWIAFSWLELFCLATRGQVTTASIIDIRKEFVPSSDDEKPTEYRATYRFNGIDASEKPISVTGSHTISEDDYAAYCKQKTVTVKYVQGNPVCFKVVREDEPSKPRDSFTKRSNKFILSYLRYPPETFAGPDKLTPALLLYTILLMLVFLGGTGFIIHFIYTIISTPGGETPLLTIIAGLAICAFLLSITLRFMILYIILLLRHCRAVFRSEKK